MAQLISVQLLVSAQVMISQLDFEPRIRLCAGSAEPAWDSLSLPLSAPPPMVHSCALTLPLYLK